MKDIDFDELDRAVSSVLGQKTSDVKDEGAQVSSSATAEKSVEPAPQPTAEPTPAVPAAADTTPVSVSPATVTPAVASPSSSVPLAVKRRGKFMDMVHPSATMTSPKSGSVKPAPSHHGPVLKPVTTPAPEPSEPVLDEKPTTPEPVVTPRESTVEHKAEPIAAVDEGSALIGAEPAVVEDGSHTLPAHTGDTPSLDPLAFTPAKPADDAVSEAADEKSEDEFAKELGQSTGESTPPAVSSLATTMPQTTPFLADTKVEKRPLGGFKEDEASAGVPDTDAQKPPTVPLPRELQSDVLKVESATEGDQGEAPYGTAPFATAVEAAPEPKDEDRVEGHPLFDTSTYHEPITAVPRHGMPAWLKWVLGLLVCLAIGAGVGYFLFTAGL